MVKKTLKTRIQNKHDTAANWKLATNFKPLKGEMVVYDDLNKIKVGDGETSVADLPFLGSGKCHTYTGIIGTANNTDSASFFFGEIIPTSYAAEWKIHYALEVTIPGQTNYKSLHDVWLSGTNGAHSSYSSLNSIGSTSYRPIYYHAFRGATQATYTAGHGHIFGVNLTNSSNPTNTSYKRTVSVALLDTINCDVTFFSEIKKITAVPGYSSSSSYNSQSNLDAYTNGLKHTGDDNDISTLYDYSSHKILEGWIANSFIGMSSDGCFTRVINGDGTLGTNGFEPGKFFGWDPSARTAGTTSATWGANFYTTRVNCALPAAAVTKWGLGTLAVTDSIYIKCSKVASKTALLPVSVTKTLPTSADGYIYFYLGKPYQAYTNTTSSINIYMTFFHPMYYYSASKEKVVEISSAEFLTVDSDNVFTGANTFRSGNLQVGDDSTHIILNDSGIESGGLQLLLNHPSTGIFNYKFPCNKTVDESPVNIVTENEDNTFTGANTFKETVTVEPTASSGAWSYCKLDPTGSVKVQGTPEFGAAGTTSVSAKEIYFSGNLGHRTRYRQASILYNNGTSTEMTLNFPAVNSRQTAQTIATLEGNQTFTGSNTFSSIGVENSIDFENDDGDICTLKINPLSGQGDTSSDITVTLPQVSGTLATQDYVQANPAGTGTNTLYGIKIGNGVYSLPGGSSTTIISKTISAWPTATTPTIISFTTDENNKISNKDTFKNIVIQVGINEKNYVCLYPSSYGNIIYKFVSSGDTYTLIITGGVGQMTYTKPAEIAGSNTFTGSNTFSSVKVQTNAQTYTTISPTNISGKSGGTSYSLVIPVKTSTIATLEDLSSLFTYADNTLTINI